MAVIAGLVPAPSLPPPLAGEVGRGDGRLPDYRDGRDKPGHDQMGRTSFALFLIRVRLSPLAR